MAGETPSSVLGNAAAAAAPPPAVAAPSAPVPDPKPTAPVNPTEPKPAEGAKPDAAAEAKATADKAAAELAAKPFTDVAQLKLAEGLKLDDAAMKEFLPIAKELGFTAKQAQGIVELNAKLEASRAAAAEAAYVAAQKAGVEEMKADPNLGGANWDKSMALAGKALQRFGNAKFLQRLNETGLGDDPEMARFLVAVGKAGSEDSISGTNGEPKKTPANDRKTFLGELYNHPTSKALKFD